MHITPSATNPDLTQNGWNTFYRVLGNDAVQGPAAAKFITGKLQAKKVCVSRTTPTTARASPPPQTRRSRRREGCQDKVTTGQKDFSATVDQVINSKADAVFYAGYYPRGPWTSSWSTRDGLHRHVRRPGRCEGRPVHQGRRQGC